MLEKHGAARLTDVANKSTGANAGADTRPARSSKRRRLVMVILKEETAMAPWLVSKAPADKGNAKSWAQTTLDAAAMDEIKAIIEQYLPPDSRISTHAALSKIIRTIEMKTGHQFIHFAR